MPELPEVETVRRDLAPLVVGRCVVSVRVTGRRSVRRCTPHHLATRLTGATFGGVDRRGKYLVLPLATGDWLVVHLRMSGQLRWARRGDPLAPHTHVVLGFDGAEELRFVDPRTFGEVFVTRPERLAAEAPQLLALGWDPLDAPVGAAAFARQLRGRRQQLKALLMDQSEIAGLGNIYSDEILHRARLRHDRPAGSLEAAEARRLHRAVLDVVREAVAARGSTLGDRQYVDLRGRPGTYGAQHRVYGREGQPCLRCHAPVERARFQGRSTFFCPRCQR